MEFRKATMDDIPALVDYRIRELLDEGQVPAGDIYDRNVAYFTKYMKNGQMEAWVCEEDGVIIGTGSISWYAFPLSYTNGNGLKAYITNIYTAPAYRGQGIASMILEILENRAAERNVSRIWLEASEYGMPVYKKRGYRANDAILILDRLQE